MKIKFGTMRKELEKLLEFNKKFNVLTSTSPTLDIPQESKDLMIKLMTEELLEVVDEIKGKDLQNLAKELADLLFTVYGTIVTFGLQDKFPEIFDEVVKSNMSKLGEDGKPIFNEYGKVLKGPNYKKADMAKFFN